MRQLLRTISRADWIFVGVFSLVVIAVTTSPYIYGFFSAPAGTVYNGLHVLSPGDLPVYYSYINQVKAGEWLVKDLFTSEAQALGTFNIWWTGVGLLAKFFSLSNTMAFQLARILTIPVFIAVAYVFLAYFFISSRQRKIALIFLAFSSGLGAYFAAPLSLLNFPQAGVYFWPIDLWISEAVTFNALFQTSHFIASLTLTLLIFLLMILSFEEKKISYAIVAGGLSLVYFNFHPYYLPVIFGTLGLYLFVLMVQKNKFLWIESAYLVLAFLISLPSIAYHIWLLQHEPVIAQRALQNVTTISPLVFVLIGYGSLWLGGGLGLFLLVKNKLLANKHLFLLLWLAVNIFLIYSPFPFHSRYTQGLHVVLVVFTVAGLFEGYNYLKRRLKPQFFDFWVNNPTLLGVLFVVLFMPTVVYSLSRDFYLFSRPVENNVDKVFYLSEDLISAFKFLSRQPKGQVVLAADIPAKFIPSLSGQAVYIAHAHETLFYPAKTAYLFLVYGETVNLEFKKKFLQNNVDYVLFSQYEKELGNFNPSAVDFLELAFDSPEAKLYRVVQANPE